jgi:hypothetical protein
MHTPPTARLPDMELFRRAWHVSVLLLCKCMMTMWNTLRRFSHHGTWSSAPRGPHVPTGIVCVDTATSGTICRAWWRVARLLLQVPTRQALRTTLVMHERDLQGFHWMIRPIVLCALVSLDGRLVRASALTLPACETFVMSTTSSIDALVVRAHMSDEDDSEGLTDETVYICIASPDHVEVSHTPQRMRQKL